MNNKVILCYGDSNTWGYVPNSDPANVNLTRYARHERWPGILQNLLGEFFYVIEEGLNGRTTNLDYHFPPDRNGKTYLPPCLYTHAPIDLVILALGGNDFKTYFNREAEDIKNGLAQLVDIVQNSKYGPKLSEAPQVLIIPPPIPLPIAEEVTDENGVYFFKDGIKKAKELVELYKLLAQEKNCLYLDISKAILPSHEDGVHLDGRAHKKIAEMIFIIMHRFLG